MVMSSNFKRSYLESYQSLIKEADILAKERDKLHKRIKGMEDVPEIFNEKIRKLDEKLILNFKKQAEIENKIEGVEDPAQREALFLRYIEGLKVWEVSETMNYSERWTSTLLKRAVEAIDI